MAAPDPDRAARARRGLARAGVTVLHEDNHLLVVVKPAGLLSQGGPAGQASLVEAVSAYRREAEGKPGAAFVGLVHRLDRNVSGVLVVAKTTKAASRLSALFRDRDAALRKTYLAWVAGVPREARGEARDRLERSGGVTRPVGGGGDGGGAGGDEGLGAGETEGQGRLAWLGWERDGAGPDAARLRVTLHSGATHQIRAQLAARGHPLQGDLKYGGPPGPRPALHAWQLAFPHPVGGGLVAFTAPVPPDLLRLDRRLGLRPPCGAGPEPTPGLSGKARSR